MNNSTLLTGALIFAFLLFLAARNRLGVYTSVLWGSANAAPAVGPQGGGSGATAQPGTGVSSPSAPPVAPSTSQTQTPMQKAFSSLTLPAGNGTAGQEFSDALQTAAGMMAPAGMWGF